MSRARQLRGERVLLLDLRVAPAPGTIDLEHHRAAVVAADAIDAVLIAVQGEQPAIGLQPGLGRRDREPCPG